MLYTEEAIKRRKEKVNKIKGRIKIIIYIILVPLLIYNISLIAQAIINPSETPNFFGIKTYIIISGSMMPELEIGDIVVVKEVQEELEIGDIISFRRGQTVVTHRISEVIVKDGKKEFKTKGDKNNVEDTGTVTYDKIEGKVVKRIPKLGNISLIFRDKMTIIIIVLLYYIYLVHEQSTQRKRNIRKKKRQEYEANVFWKEINMGKEEKN